MRNNDETWSRCLAQRRTHIRPISDTAEIVCYGMMPPLCFKHAHCKPGRFMQWSGNLSIIRAICHGNMTGPFWSNLFLRACLTFLVTVTSLPCVFCLLLKDCWRIVEGLMFQMFQQLAETGLSGSCCRITLLTLATATFVAVYGVLCVLIQACPTPKRLGRCWFCFKRTGIGKLLESSVVSAQPHL